MNTKDYISSGILEEYVLGALSDQERREVECLSSIYPEISEALHAIEDDIFVVAQETAVKPPEFLKANILSALDDEKTAEETVVSDNDARVVQMNTDAQAGSSRGWKIAAVISLLAACGAAVGLFMKGGVSEEKMTLAQSEISSLKTSIDSLQTSVILAQQENSDLKQNLSFLSNANITTVKLAAVENRDPGAEVVLYWDSESGDAMLKVNNLPVPPEDKQYQLWGLVDGQPIDMGVFDMSDINALQSMKGLKGAQIFAITLEKKGGNPTPTLEEMYVLGKVDG